MIFSSIFCMPNLPRRVQSPSHPPSIKCQHCDPLPSSPRRGHASCSSCRAWRDGLATLSAKGGGTSTSGTASSDVGPVDDDATCRDKNDPPNKASPRRGGSPMKSRGGGTKIKSPSQGLGGVLCLSTTTSPPALCLMHRITASPPLESCRGISNGFYGQSLTYAARSMLHTVNQLQQWANEPDLGVKSFAS